MDPKFAAKERATNKKFNDRAYGKMLGVSDYVSTPRGYVLGPRRPGRKANEPHYSSSGSDSSSDVVAVYKRNKEIQWTNAGADEAKRYTTTATGMWGNGSKRVARGARRNLSKAQKNVLTGRERAVSPDPLLHAEMKILGHAKRHKSWPAEIHQSEQSDLYTLSATNHCERRYGEQSTHCQVEHFERGSTLAPVLSPSASPEASRAPQGRKEQTSQVLVLGGVLL